MSGKELPNPGEARASLDDVAESRRAAVTATRRPMWLDGSYATAAGIALGVAAFGGWPPIATGMGFLLAVTVAFAVLDRIFVRRRGKILDERAVGAHAARFFPMYFVVFAAGVFNPGPEWQPWYSIGVGIVVAVAGFAYLRLDDRYQTRRLAAGDYERYDLL